jgi:hypothetical protein
MSFFAFLLEVEVEKVDSSSPLIVRERKRASGRLPSRRLRQTGAPREQTVLLHVKARGGSRGRALPLGNDLHAISPDVPARRESGSASFLLTRGVVGRESDELLYAANRIHQVIPTAGVPTTEASGRALRKGRGRVAHPLRRTRSRARLDDGHPRHAVRVRRANARSQRRCRPDACASSSRSQLSLLQTL